MTAPLNRLVVMAGGTGGHVFPALAVANALRETGTQVTWLGTRAGLEASVVPEHDIEVRWITIEGLRGKGIVSWLKAPFKLVAAISQSLRALRDIKPDCVLGMGGFVAGPGGVAARLNRIPLIVHEQNAVAGLTNKYLAKVAQRVLTGFPNVTDLPASAEWVGNPVRKEITKSPQSASHGALRVLIVGGSQGAHSFNVHLPKLLSRLDVPVQVWHQSGRARQDDVKASYQQHGCDAEVSEFIDDMASAYSWADVLICRAGAMTIAECCAAGKAAVLVPFPHSAGDHQLVNAKMMVDAGAGWLIDNAELASEAVSAKLNSMLADRTSLLKMGEAAAKLHKPDALNSVVNACEEYLHA